MNNRRYFLIGILAIFLVSLFFFSFRVIEAIESRADIFQKTKIFTEILVNITERYVDEIDPDMLVDKAINAMMEELDPHSNLILPREYDRMSDRFLGYQGIGISFRMIQDKITVMRVLSGGPSERAGLKLGDYIVKIEGESAIGITTNEVQLLLKGPAGTKVNVTIDRPGVDRPIDVTITRGQAFVESIRYYYMLDDVTGYLRIDTFSRTTGDELARALQRLEGQGMQKLVLDLRGNTGGLLPQAIEVTDKFLSGKKLIVQTKGRAPETNAEHNSTDSPLDVNYPMIVLIDESSASASEIVSGALQDWDRALIIGKTSFGKGLVQSQILFDDHSALLLTIGRWYTPLGRLIQKEYENKTRLQYRIDARSDSLNILRQQMKDQPTFTTPMGRTVYGGGGITPDIEIESTFVAYFGTRSISELIDNNLADDPFFRYAQELAVKYPDRWKNVDDLIQEYKLEGTELDNYIQFLKDNDFKFNEQMLDEENSTSFIETHIRMYIAEFLWGDNQRWQAYVIDDNVLWESLKHFPEAEKLVKN